jgi:transcriptional regulator with XRE-family HTH domain
MKFPNRIRFLREQQGFSQEELGRRTGLKQNHVSMFELGKRKLTQVTMAKFAKALGVHPAELIDPAEMIDLRNEIEPLGHGFGNVAALAARKGLRLYKVLTDSVACAGPDFGVGQIIGVDEVADPKTGDVVLVAIRRAEGLSDKHPVQMLWQYIEQGLLITNRSTNNVILNLDHPGLNIQVLGVVLRGDHAD